MNAVDRFDPARGFRFSTYAWATITGELRRYFRATSWPLHVPRGTQEAVLLVAWASEELEPRLGRAPSISELAQRTGLSQEGVLEAMLARHLQRVGSLDQPLASSDADDGEVQLADIVGHSAVGLSRVEDRVALRAAIEQLDEHDHRLLSLRFVRGLTQSEIASELGCSQMQVSRLLRQLLQRLERTANQHPRMRARALAGRRTQETSLCRHVALPERGVATGGSRHALVCGEDESLFNPFSCADCARAVAAWRDCSDPPQGECRATARAGSRSE